jgi:hypothetical protein
MSRKEGEPPRKVEIPLRLSYFAPLREQKNPPRRTRNAAGQAAKKMPLCEKKNPPRRTRKEGETQRKKSLCGFASRRLCENLLFFKKSIGNTVEIA